MNPKLREFIGESVVYLEDGTSIYGKDKDGGLQIVADIRGWGAIQNLFKNKDGSIRFDEAEKFQDELGAFFRDAINEKLERYQ